MRNGDMPARPVSEAVSYNLVHGDDGYAELASGLTKREHFAAMTMQSFISHEEWLKKVGMNKLAALSVEAADALLAELEKPQ